MAGDEQFIRTRKIGDLRIISNDEVEWRVPDLDIPEMILLFSDYESPEFKIGGERWALWLFPCEPGSCIIMSLQRLSFGPLKIVQFSLFLKAANGQQEYGRQGIVVFGARMLHNIDTLLSLEEYSRRKLELCNSGSFTIVCKIKLLYVVELCEKFNDLSEDFNKLRKKYKESQLKLEETEKENGDIKEELDACKSNRESISKEKLRLEDDLKAMTENLESITKELNHLRKKYDDTQLTLERTMKGKDELDVCKADKVTRENWGTYYLSKSSKILEDFKELFLKQKECDVVIKVKDQEFSAHRAILIARSSVFESTFRNDMKGKATGIINVEDCDPSSFSDFLQFLYCEDSDNISVENVFSLFVTADKYDVKDLKVKCIEFIKNNLSVDIFCDAITLALKYSVTELIKLTADFFTKNLQRIIVTVKWQSFLAENPTQSNQLFIKALVTDKNSDI